MIREDEKMLTLIVPEDGDLSKIIQQQSEGETRLEKSLPLKDMDLPKEESKQQWVLHGYGTHNSHSDIAAQQP